MSLDLKKYVYDIKRYIFFLKEWLSQILALLSIVGERRQGRGVWVLTPQGEKKIVAVGVRVHQWIISHRISLNVSNDLSPYDSIVPCGLKDFGVTSLKDLGLTVSLEEVDTLLQKTFESTLGKL